MAGFGSSCAYPGAAPLTVTVGHSKERDSRMTLFRWSISLSLATAWLCLSSAPAGAQWRSNQTGFNYNNPMSSLAATMVMNKAREDALARRLGVNPSSSQNSGNRSTAEAQGQSPPRMIDESV